MFFSFQLKAQNRYKSIPKNPKPGKYYVLCFDYDKELEWIEKDYDITDGKSASKQKTKKELIEAEQKRLKMKAYQEKLIALGYDVNVTGYLNEKTIEAHHKYLRKKKKEERRKKRDLKRKKT